MRSRYMTEEEKQKKQVQKMVQVLDIGAIFGIVGAIVGYLIATI